MRIVWKRDRVCPSCGYEFNSPEELTEHGTCPEEGWE